MSSNRSRGGGRIRSFFVGLAAIVGVIAIGLVVAGQFFKLPFTTTTRDHSAPPVLLELRDLADFHAAQAQFEVTVDQEQDVAWMPSFIAGERVQYIAVGTVDAVVDFASLSDSAVQLGKNNESAVITLPKPYLTDPVLDTEVSHVMNRDRGLVNRVVGVFTDNPTSEHGLVKTAQKKIADAALSTDLLTRAETNTRSMLVSMLHSLGIRQVYVRFEAVSDVPTTEVPTTEAPTS